MKKTLYIMRHGQTMFNQLKRMQGWCDSPLTKYGIAQAKIAGEWFKNKKIDFKHGYCSTSERTSDTLENVVPKIPYHRLKGIKEQSFGKFEAQPEFLNPPSPYGDFFKYAGGETDTELKNRVVKTISDIAANDAEKQILIVTHGIVIAQFIRSQIKEGQTFPRFTNCSIIVFEYENEKFNFKEIINHDYSKIDHLAE
ncbi:Phosphoglycerate mutase [Spiroplasma clarkii]|uniref:Phosphoglycerate mutase n=1 Tax=Spiroplasma clarkii TaxID=2139 RepID=A0A1Y0KZ10_9MOLU|nr:histidine phosphatase family protein [Spiroplasma clarkii]ARU90976.1 Phosphoglycerate mutase [Spiroplasma clarkii]ATX70418.1 hypothetical protein SCLAR_v1c00830 [Spiroplasma clarkii]